MCGGLSCSKNTLLGLNIVYLMVSFLLIGVATYGKTSSYITSLPLLGGIVASGVFLLFVAVLGLIVTIKRHQLGLFLYMVILLVIFVIQFSVACACLGVSKEYELSIAEKAWNASSAPTRIDAEIYFGCCGFRNATAEGIKPECKKVRICRTSPETCPPCKTLIEDKIEYAFDASGGLGLFFAFTEVIGVVCAYRYRNMAE